MVGLPKPQHSQVVPRERIPFAEAIAEPLLFQKQFNRLTPGVQAILKIIYGLPLTKDDLAYWDGYQGGGRFDELGYLLDVTDCGIPYQPGREFDDITLVVGRRATKSSGVSSFIVAYEALCGNHRTHVGIKAQDPVFLQVAQDLATAKANLRQFILHLLEESPLGQREIVDKRELSPGRSSSITSVSLRLKTCGLITVGPPTIKLRSQAIAVCAMDEVGFWPKDREAANPDIEVEIAVKPAMMQFPYRKLVKTSTPMTEEGLLWRDVQIGTYGSHLHTENRTPYARKLVLQGPSAPLAPPSVLKRDDLIAERAKDGEAFAREYLARFAKSVSGFLSPSLLRASVAPRVRQRAPEPGRLYIATLDPAFRRDAFAFCLGHLQDGEWYQDFVTSWRGTKEQPLSPAVAMGSVAETCRQYGVRIVTTDQYHQESLSELAYQQGLSLDPCYLTHEVKSKIWGTAASMLNQASALLPALQQQHGATKLHLLDHAETVDELAKMERRLTPAGNVLYEGKHDDIATVIALNVWRALQMGEVRPVKVAPAKKLTDIVHDNIMRQRHQGGQRPWWAS